MFTVFGVPSPALFGQLLLGLINGSFYAILSLGLAVIFGLLNIINFTHGALYMAGAFVAWMLLNYAGIGYWWALGLAPVIVGVFGVLLERFFVSELASGNRRQSFILLVVSLLSFLIFITPTYLQVRPEEIAAKRFLSGGLTSVVYDVIYYLSIFGATGSLIAAVTVGIIVSAIDTYRTARAPAEVHADHLYGLLLTFGLALIIQGIFRNQYGVSGLPYAIPAELSGGQRIAIGSTPIMFLPNYRGWVIVASAVVCLATWFVIEKTKLGSYLRAATENPTLVQAFGVNVPLMITLTYGFGVALAGFAGVLAAPIYSVNPNMGGDIIIVVFAVVVIGGMGSILGAILTGFGLGLVEGLTKVFYPEASATVIFVIMVLVLLVKPAGLFGRSA